ncbi:hypothetical protein K4F52_000369 [Lecanicillium sp. MT-2017a]|nr:hypothetical protein K4F52_000369 [Lecanicillium sp. MT-2017a]
MSRTEQSSTDWRDAIYPVLAIDQAYANPKRHDVVDFNSVTEHNRTYQSYKAGGYLLPNDAQEHQRLDIQHTCTVALLDDKLALAPLENPKTVLDLGTGTGVWAIEFAKQNPEANVIGTDLSEVQPANDVANCTFIKEDIEHDRWSHTCLFDYIHVRFTVTCFSNITPILAKIYDHLEPGGWVEFQENTGEVLSTDGSTDGSDMETLSNALMKGLSVMGKDPTWIGTLSERLAKQGFTEITEKIMPFPIGGWPRDPKFKEVGESMVPVILMAMGAALKLVLASGWSQVDAEAAYAKAREELQSNRIHAFMPLYVVYARKPNNS